MLPTLLLSSSLLFTGGSPIEGGESGAISTNTEYLNYPRVGLSSREEVIHLWGQPAKERVEKDHIICSWPRGKTTTILTFSARLDRLVDRKVVKKPLD